MLVLISNDELQKFPPDLYDYTDVENPVLISEAQYNFKLLAQNMQNYLCCGLIIGDENLFKLSNIKYEEAIDIPGGFEQRVFKDNRYGKYLTLQEITRFSLIENDIILKIQSDTDYLAIMTGVDLNV